MRVYVINLDRDSERLRETLQEFRAAGLGAMVERVPAVDAAAPDFEAPGYAPHSWRDRWELKRSEQAVFESHRKVWQRIAGDDAGQGIVCEDDILVSSDMKGLLEALDCDRFGIVKLDGFFADRRYGKVQAMNGWPVRDIVEPVPSAACYAVSRDAARALLARSTGYCATLDDFVFARQGGFCPVQIDPAVAVQRMCCAAAGGDTAPQSLRERRDTDPPARGPVLFRLQKELRRALRRIAGPGGARIRPALAGDLPPYRM